MGANWGNHERDYKELEPAIKNYASKALKTEVDDFIKHYKVCEDLQDKLPAALVKARAEGTAGSSLSDFKKNKGFYDAYKALDKAVDVLWKSQVKCKQLTNEAKQTVNDLKTLTEHMQTDLKLHEKELKESQDDLKKTQDKAKSGKGTLSPSVIKAADALEKDFKKNAPALEKLGKTIAGDIKDLVEAGNVYKSGVDQKMDNYAAKFEKMIDKTLDLAPPSDAKDVVGLPTALQEKVLVVAAKKAVADAKQIEKHCKAALEKAEKDKALAAPELKAASTGLAALKKVLAVQGGARKKYAPFIKKAENSKEIYKQFKFIDDAFATAEKTLVTTMKAIAAIK